MDFVYEPRKPLLVPGHALLMPRVSCTDSHVTWDRGQLWVLLPVRHAHPTDPAKRMPAHPARGGQSGCHFNYGPPVFLLFLLGRTRTRAHVVRLKPRAAVEAANAQ